MGLGPSNLLESGRVWILRVSDTSLNVWGNQKTPPKRRTYRIWIASTSVTKDVTGYLFFFRSEGSGFLADKGGIYYRLPWEPKTFIFGGYNPYIGGLKPSFFMVLGSKGGGKSYFFMFTPKIGEDGSMFDEHILLNGLVQPPTRIFLDLGWLRHMEWVCLHTHEWTVDFYGKFVSKWKQRMEKTFLLSMTSKGWQLAGGMVRSGQLSVWI